MSGRYGYLCGFAVAGEDGVFHYVYTVTPKEELNYGGATVTASNRTVDSRRWVRITLSTDISLDMTTLMLRDTVAMKNGNFHVTATGSSATYSKEDTYDLDNDGSKTDKYATINSTTASVKIYPVEE